MPLLPELAAEPNLGGRRQMFALAVALVAVALEGGTVLASRSLSDTSWLVWLLVELGLAVAAVASIVALGRVGFSKPLQQARDRSRRNEHLYRTLARDCVDVIGKLGRSRLAAVEGQALAALLGYDETTACRLPLARFVHPEDRATARSILRLLGPYQPRVSMTVRLVHAAGQAIWADVCVRRIAHDDGGTDTIVTVRDVTQRHREAEELRSAMATARRAQAEADQANKAKSEFLACMSHEIRSPLNSVIGFAGLLLERDDLAPQARLYGERVRAAGKALLTVVDDILDFSRVEAGVLDLTPAPFPLSGLIDECLSIVQQEALTKHLTLRVNLMERLPAAVLGDAARLRQVLLNLLYNAIKFTHQGSVLLDIRTDRGAAGQESIRFSVVDTGIGIARSDLPRLFERFAQVDGSIRRTYGGTGLGLAISKRIVELMGGRIGVESEKDVGSTFWFTLPLPAQDLVPADVRATPSPRVAPRLILLVEDVAMNQDLVRHILEADGHTVDIVGNGAEAIMAVQDLDYDLVLMDIQMPHLDGLTTTRRIRQLAHRCRDVPIVAMTANALPEQTATARAAGMIDVIHKPFSPEQIHAVLARVTDAGGDAAAPAPPDDPARSDQPVAHVLGKLAGLIGDARTKELLANLATSLSSRFDGDPATAEGRALLKRQAHASVAGSGMLGFVAFAASCKHFETAAEDASFARRLEALRAEVAVVVAEAGALARSSAPLSTRDAA